MSLEPLDADDLDRLVREHLPAAVRFATRLTGRTESAEDVVQEALLRVARKYRTFRGDSRFRTWFFQIIINVVRDQQRRPKVQTLELRRIPPAADATAARLSAEELGQLIAQRVSQLPQRQREVIVLTVYEDLSVSEVARLLGISEQNVHAALYLARRRLREELADQFVEKH